MFYIIINNYTMIKKITLILLTMILWIFSLNVWFANTGNNTNTRIDHSEKTTLVLAADIGKMADRIWKMADRIGVMANRILIMANKILKTQEIQSKNLQTTQNNILKTLDMINKSINANNKLLSSLISSNNAVVNCMCKK